MRAVGLDYRERRLITRDVAEPESPAGSQVLLRVREIGVCGTDRELAGFRLGFPPEGADFLVIGHEALAQVVETGPAVKHLRPGDWVAPMIRRPCHPPCPSCARGRPDLCFAPVLKERGIFGLDGYFAEYAVDEEADLARVPEELVDYAVLMEPLSVVEKAVATALRVHEPGCETALVLGAGPIGLLSALALQARGLRVWLHSAEPAGHPRAQLARAAGVEYLTVLAERLADVVIEATGSGDAALAGLRCLAPLGVMVVLGADNAYGEIPFRDLIVHNRTVFGSVNASPKAFVNAASDLGHFDKEILGRLIHRLPFGSFHESILGPPGRYSKLTHVIWD
ncbi:MAG: alcohol dehydrogenase catalytic domain-containing protein [Bryobacteraceae bacterium]|nr:alcohol dehydrogenase catalytic domain-containing protein [Bryobacteraceae bacterium]